MNKKGVTLVELLAGIILFGIIASLVSVILSTVTRANKDIQISALANREGNFISALIQNQLITLEVTNAAPTSCGTNCLILLSEQRYILSGSNEIVLDSTDQTLQISINNGQISLLRINDGITIYNNTYTVDYFTLGPQTSISYTAYSGRLRVQITLDLIDEYGVSHIYLVSQIYSL